MPAWTADCQAITTKGLALASPATQSGEESEPRNRLNTQKKSRRAGRRKSPDSFLRKFFAPRKEIKRSYYEEHEDRNRHPLQLRDYLCHRGSPISGPRGLSQILTTPGCEWASSDSFSNDFVPFVVLRGGHPRKDSLFYRITRFPRLRIFI